ncbi:L-seryl-tRNA(Sec) selenium transferase [Undibacterium sp.]|uniref:L-seryl-tRNA(Sec) selenium transferase n=1 Tax=Undibacterium sp. TaxID=1914977 RepID=UPI00374DED5B
MTQPPPENPKLRMIRLPSVDKILGTPSALSLADKYGHSRVLGEVRKLLAELRAELLGDGGAAATYTADAETATENLTTLAATVAERLAAADVSPLKCVFNLTGTVLHTNLGRALLPDVAVQAVMRAMTSPMNLEFDLDTGKRGDRDDLVEGLLCELTGAESATVVNNNAAAVLLLLNTLAPQRDVSEVIVSRGELVEIGGAFRIPDIMQRAGAKLREIGTTNRTHAADYANAVNPNTALMMKVHCSNYAISGFTKSVDLQQIAALGRERGIPTAVDLGSGTLVDLSEYGLPREPTVRETVAAGADLVTFSGDKLLGGPQAGIIVGRADLIAQIKRNPLKRALRVGKLTLAALEPVLALYRAPELLRDRLTTLRLLTRPREAMQRQAEELAPVLQQSLGDAYVVGTQAMLSQIGSGALPVDQLPSYGISIQANAGQRQSNALGKLEKALRELPRPVLGRIAQDTLWLDLRCLEHGQQQEFAQQLALLQGSL